MSAQSNIRTEQPDGALVELVYELLDAHLDTKELADAEGLDDFPEWCAHLEYLTALQRTARELLAGADTEPRP